MKTFHCQTWKSSNGTHEIFVVFILLRLPVLGSASLRWMYGCTYFLPTHFSKIRQQSLCLGLDGGGSGWMNASMLHALPMRHFFSNPLLSSWVMVQEWKTTTYTPPPPLPGLLGWIDESGETRKCQNICTLRPNQGRLSIKFTHKVGLYFDSYFAESPKQQYLLPA